MDKESYRFDLETQRFIVSRWETELGERVLADIVGGIKRNVEIRGILDPYVLDHPDNSNPYAYPIYPKGDMGPDAFWVITQDDLRGVHAYNESLTSSRSLEKKAIAYGRFYNCDFSNSNLEMSDMSYCVFDKCRFNDTIFAGSGGYNISFKDCDLKGACFWNAGFRDCEFDGSDLTYVYFEGAVLQNVGLNYRTKFDLRLRRTWETRSMPAWQRPDILRSIRLGYEKAEVWDLADQFLYAEKVAERQSVLWPQLCGNITVRNTYSWIFSLGLDLFNGYSTKPIRAIIFGIGVALVFSVIFFLSGTPNNPSRTWGAARESIYLSFTTFINYGFGDVAYSACRPAMRFLSTAEAWIGTVIVSLFLVALARKLFR